MTYELCRHMMAYMDYSFVGYVLQCFSVLFEINKYSTINQSYALYCIVMEL